MRYNAVLLQLIDVFMKCLERYIGDESNCDNVDVSSVQTLWFQEITFCLHEKHFLLKKKYKYTHIY